MNARESAAVPSCDHCRTPRRELVRARGMALCLECCGELNATGFLRPRLAVVSDDQVYNQDQDQDPDRVTTSSPAEGLGLGCIGAPSELDELRAAYRTGALQPLDVELGPIPAHFGPVQRAVAEDMRLQMGLRSAEGEDRPLPYPASAAVSAGLAKDKVQASRVIRRLVNAGVVVHVGVLKRFKSRDGLVLDGTKLYAPPSGGAS